MARSFSGKEAKKLIADHQQLRKTYTDILAYRDTCTNALQNEGKLLLGKRAFSEWVNGDIQAGVPSEPIPQQFHTLMLALVRSKTVQPIADCCGQLKYQYEFDITAKLDDVAAGTNGVKWMFASNTKKAQADAAFQSLSELLAGSYAQTIWSCEAEVNAVKYQAEIAALDEFSAEPSAYRDTFFAACKESDTAECVTALLDKLRALGALSDKASARIQSEQQQVSETANRMVMADVLEILKTIPVEELNRDKGGFRVKTLRDFGFETMADIYSATERQIASANGISDTAAAAIKLLAQNRAEQTVSSAKIKLNADSRTPESTQLLKNIHTYRTLSDKQHTLEVYQQAHAHNFKTAEAQLAKLENCAEWLFLAYDEKRLILNAYEDLSAMCNGEYAQTVSQICQGMLNFQPLDDDAIWADFEKNSILYFNVLETLVPGAIGGSDTRYGLPEDLAREIQDEGFFPDGLLCELRRYQELGVKYILHQERVLLGDEMGLGKTVQAIAAMVSLKNTGATHFLVVCPASVLANWCREIRSKSKLSVTKIHGAAKEDALLQWQKSGGVAVTTYEATALFTFEPDEKIGMVIVDEAHYIKNQNAKRTQNTARICEHAERLLFMTGTALENNVDEMISLIRILQPQLASEIHEIAFLSSAPQFREKIAPVYYRRKREDVLTELPELIENREWCTLLPDEEKVYEDAVLAKQYPQARQMSWNAPDLTQSAKANRLLELIADAKEDGRKIIVFSFFRNTIETICKLLGEQCSEPVNGSTPPAKRQEIIDKFENAPAGSVLAAQIQAGGTGLNIQAASVVILCEPQFKPSIEHQAVSRAYRMGQTRNVLVYRLLCEDTIEEKILELLANKQEQFDAFADESTAAAQTAELDDTTFQQIIQEEIDRINEKRNSA